MRGRVLSTIMVLGCLSSTACTFPPRIYRMDVRQGNHMSAESTQKIKVGMSKQQILDLMGTPAIDHFFEKDRWDYYYHLQPGNGNTPSQQHVMLIFKGDKLQRFEVIS